MIGVVAGSDKRRTSTRNVGNSQSSRDETTYKEDVNGCCHDNPSFFQNETSNVYYNDAFRSKREDKGIKNVATTCLMCKGNMFKLLYSS
jgi:hypothetical protein